MAYEPFLRGSIWDKENNPNLIPKHKWLGLKSEVSIDNDGNVVIKFGSSQNFELKVFSIVKTISPSF
jgi:hypothetical protein